MKKIIISTALIFFGGKILSQNPTISPQVINSAGDHRQVGNSNVWITDNVGEPFTETLGPNGALMITQGFIQPEAISITGFSASVKVNNVTCMDKNDGAIFVNLTKSSQAVNYEATYKWLPANTCTNSVKCDSLNNLMAQTYTLQIIINYTNSVGAVKADSSINRVITVAGSSELCKVKIFSGITPNDDGINDAFTIENIEEFPNSHVMIFNRWGAQLADIKNYNNKTNSWPAKDKLDNLLPSTYFYILDLGDGSKPIKGWVELIKN